MASPLITVFIFQLVLALIQTAGAQTINDILFHLFSLLSFAPTTTSGKDELRLRKEILKVKAEMSATSAQDDFAKWARLRRQFDKLQEEYKKYASSQSASRSSFDSRVNTIRFLAMNGFRLYVQWNYTRQPMYWLPKGWLPWYGEWILSFPYAPRGSVSVQVWQMACGSVLAMMIEAIKSITMLVLGRVVNSKRKSRQAQPPKQPVKQAS